MKKKSLDHDIVSGLLLGVMMTALWLLQVWAGWHEYMATRTALGIAPTFDGESGYGWVLMRITANAALISLPGLVSVILFCYFVQRSGVSPEVVDENMERLKSIDRKLDSVTRAVDRHSADFLARNQTELMPVILRKP